MPAQKSVQNSSCWRFDIMLFPKRLHTKGMKLATLFRFFRAGANFNMQIFEIEAQIVPLSAVLSLKIVSLALLSSQLFLSALSLVITWRSVMSSLTV